MRVQEPIRVYKIIIGERHSSTSMLPSKESEDVDAPGVAVDASDGGVPLISACGQEFGSQFEQVLSCRFWAALV